MSAQAAPENEETRAETPSPKPPERRRSKLKWFLIGGLISVPVLVGVLWILIHSVPWMGPFVANTLRSLIGTDNVARLEDFVYAVEDRVNQTVKADETPKAYWDVPEETKLTAPPPSAPAKDAPRDQKPSLPAFDPADPGPLHEGFSAKGDGKWVPMIDPRRPEEAPRMMKTLLHPDKSRGWAELFVVAVDLRQVDVMMMAGYQEPRTEKKEAEGYVRAAKIPSDHWEALLGAFNGGFMAEHGRYGFSLDGILFLDPKEDACTLAQFKDGSYTIASWKNIAERKDDMSWFRQAPSCMYENDEMHPSLRGAHHRKWGATLDGNTVIRRSAVGMSRDRQILYVGITNHTTAKVLAQGMHHVGAVDVAQMDVNWSYPKFVTYEPDKSGQLIPVALASGFEFSDKLYLRERSMRDFFYLVRKEEVRREAAAEQANEAPTQQAPLAPSSPTP